jgi:DNA-binding MarR family transcriptional regulator
VNRPSEKLDHRKQVIAEIDELLAEAPLEYCRLLLKSVQRRHKEFAATQPPADLRKASGHKHKEKTPNRSAEDEAALQAWCRPGQRGLTVKQKELVLEIYRTGRRRARNWVPVNRLLRATTYFSASSLCQAIHRLEQRGLFETKREPNGNMYVRLLFDCFEYSHTGRPLIMI